MLTLYDYEPSGNCYKVRLLLAQLGIRYRRVAVDSASGQPRPEEVLVENPAGRVPVLALADGKVLTESNAILWHLAVGTALLSSDPWEQTQTLRWLFFEQNQHEPNIAVVRYWTAILGRPEDFVEGVRRRRAAGHAALGVMDHWLGDHAFFVGERYSIADIALFAYTHVAPEGGFALEGYPRVTAWLDRVRAQPGWVPIAAESGGSATMRRGESR